MQFIQVATVALSAALSFSVFADAKYKAGDYKIDPAHSKVGFEIPHLVVSTVEGHFNDFEGSVSLKDKFEKSTVKTTVKIDSIDTGQPKRDSHLKSPDFFDAAKYPKMTFESTEITGTPESFKLTGNLTLKGVTKKVTFDSKFLGMVPDDGMGSERAVFTGTTTLKRTDYGLTWSKAVEAGPVVGETLTVNLRVEATRPAASKKK